MNNTMTRTIKKSHLSIKTQTIATLAAIVGAVVVPQMFHAMGAVSGLGDALGNTFLPMHLPIILVGLLAGPYAGAISGLLGPMVSYALTGMPAITLLPFMMLELMIYGLSAGLLRNVKVPTIGKVVVIQFAGRVVRALAILAAVNLLGNTSIKVSIIWTSIAAGIPGLVLQWTLLPLIIYRIENSRRA